MSSEFNLVKFSNENKLNKERIDVKFVGWILARQNKIWFYDCEEISVTANIL